jgi:Tol biopolymer transport system component/predicted Ser/Thr protein kinase
MPTAGDRFGPYEILAPIGAGGMGEVYRARDTRLGRDVALKLLPDPANRDRFEQEAKAVAALNHPNIMAVFDVGENYFVSELVDGESLRKMEPLPLRKATDIAAQIADGLAAAHAAGIVHRDLKPENIMVTRDGRAKILDFGLARVVAPQSDDPDATQAISRTDPGAVMGTVGYMSPEQVRGKPADHRSDIFSFGLVLYEMLGGKRAFHADSAVETMNAILTQDPPDLPATVPQALQQIVNHCIEKNQPDRFQSARDLAFGLRALGTVSHSSGQVAAIAEPGRKPNMAWIAAAAMIAIAAIAGAAWIGRATATVELPRFTRITFDRGSISGARFAPDGKTIVYSAAFEGRPFELYSTRTAAMDSRQFWISGAHVFSVSGGGDLAIALDVHMGYPAPHNFSGTLARVPLAGGAPRPLMKDVYWADWQPGGDKLAVVHMVQGVERVEFPPGNVLYQTNGWIGSLRFSQDGKRLAFSDHPSRWDDRGEVVVLDLAGKKTTVSGPWESIEGVNWKGGEIWFAATQTGYARTIYASALNGPAGGPVGGKTRKIVESPDAIVLHDISLDGRVLLSVDDGTRNQVAALMEGSSMPRNLAYLNATIPVDLAADGKMLLMAEYGSGTNYAVCLRKTDGSPTLVLGEGDPMALSPDGEWALAVLHSNPPELILLPTGAGEVMHIPKTGSDYPRAQFFPDSKRILFAGEGKLYTQRAFPMEAPQPFPGDAAWFEGKAISPDGKLVVARSASGALAIYPVDGGAARPLTVNPSDLFVRWSGDAQTLYFATPSGLPGRVYKMNIASGKIENFRELAPADAAGVFGVSPVLLTPDGKNVVYAFGPQLYALQLLDGVK